MDLKSVREEAIAATNRAFWDRQGFVPAEDSEEWEREYRRQFEQVKARHAAAGARAADPRLAGARMDARPRLDRHARAVARGLPRPRRGLVCRALPAGGRKGQ